MGDLGSSVDQYYIRAVFQFVSYFLTRVSLSEQLKY